MLKADAASVLLEVKARKQIGWHRHGNFVLEVRPAHGKNPIHRSTFFPCTYCAQIFGYEGPNMILEAAKMTLRAALNGGSMKDGLAASGCVKQLLEGLGELHKNGVVHLDIKPENIFLLERRGRVPVRERPKLRAHGSRP